MMRYDSELDVPLHFNQSNLSYNLVQVNQHQQFSDFCLVTLKWENCCNYTKKVI